MIYLPEQSIHGKSWQEPFLSSFFFSSQDNYIDLEGVSEHPYILIFISRLTAHLKSHSQYTHKSMITAISQPHMAFEHVTYAKQSLYQVKVVK